MNLVIKDKRAANCINVFREEQFDVRTSTGSSWHVSLWAPVTHCESWRQRGKRQQQGSDASGSCFSSRMFPRLPRRDDWRSRLHEISAVGHRVDRREWEFIIIIIIIIINCKGVKPEAYDGIFLINKHLVRVLEHLVDCEHRIVRLHDRVWHLWRRRTSS